MRAEGRLHFEFGGRRGSSCDARCVPIRFQDGLKKVGFPAM